MKVALVLASLFIFLSCAVVSAEILVTSSDIGPSDPTVMIHNNVGRLMTRSESWVVSTIVLPYPAELVDATEILVTIYFVPDSPDAGEVDFKVSYYTYGVGDDWNFGGVGPDVDPYDMDSVEWAIASRVQPYSDVIINRSGQAFVLDPSAPKAAQGVPVQSEQMGIDATIKVPERFDDYPEVSQADPEDVARLADLLSGVFG